MSKRILSFLLVPFLLMSISGCASTGSSEENTSVSHPTIASTSVAICEILDELGYDNVVAVPETSSELPEQYKELPTIGAPMTPDYEKIKDIAPDLVLSPKSLENTLAADYTAVGINSAFLDLSSVQGMYSAITSLGELLDCETQSSKLVADYNSYMEAYSETDEDEPNILLLMAFPDGFYLVATENSYVGNLVELAGGKNVYGKDYNGDENGFVSINPEDIVSKAPDKILVFAHYSEESAFEYMKKEFETNTAWQYYDAVMQGEIYYLPSNYFGMSATLSWTDALDYLKPILYGDKS
jgi:iron complex transport system substrate-binding protein